MRLDLIKSEQIFKGRLLEVRLDTIKNEQGKEVQREMILHPGAAVMIPCLDRERVLLIKQYRHGAERCLWEFPAGTLEPGETTESCARRELIEEVGYEAGKVTPVLSFYPTPGVSTEKMFLFLCENLTPATAAPMEDESITVETRAVSELENMIARGEIIDGKTLIGIYYLLLSNRKRGA